MEFFWIIMVLIILAPAVNAIIRTMSVNETKRKFADMGVIAGRTREDVLFNVGNPNSISTIGPGIELLQWQTPGYHIALKFTNGICDGVSHEFAA